MARLESLNMLLLISATLIAAYLPRAASQVCATVPGYTFYQLQDATGGYVITRLDPAVASSPAALAAACDATPRCNAFTTNGLLKIVPASPVFAFVDLSSEDFGDCDGVYVSSRSLSGFMMPAGLTPESLRVQGQTAHRNMQAAIAAAGRVAAQLKKGGKDPRDAKKIKPSDLKKAFDDAKVPLASSDSNLGSYTYTDVLTAMVDATWDSRTASNGSTSYSYITPVRDQRSCGSCVAFAGTAVAEAAWGAGNGVTTNNADFSEQWLFFCNGMVAGDCANGWYPGNAERVITQLNQPLESSYPYQSTYNCTKNADPVQWAGGKFSSVYYTDITAAKEHIKKWGAVMTFFNVYSDFFNWKAGSAPYVYDGASPYRGGHEVAVVGWNDAQQYWIVKNSWGPWWGESGYFRIAYGQVGIMSGASANIIGMRWNSTDPPAPPRPARRAAPAPPTAVPAPPAATRSATVARPAARAQATAAAAAATACARRPRERPAAPAPAIAAAAPCPCATRTACATVPPARPAGTACRVARTAAAAARSTVATARAPPASGATRRAATRVRRTAARATRAPSAAMACARRHVARRPARVRVTARTTAARTRSSAARRMRIATTATATATTATTATRATTAKATATATTARG